MSYGLTAKLLEKVLPLDKPVNTATLIQSVVKVAERSEKELGPEQFAFSCAIHNDGFKKPILAAFGLNSITSLSQ